MWWENKDVWGRLKKETLPHHQITIFSSSSQPSSSSSSLPSSFKIKTQTTIMQVMYLCHLSTHLKGVSDEDYEDDEYEDEY